MYSRPRTSRNSAPLPVHSVAAQSPASVTDLRYSSQPRLKYSAKLSLDSSMICLPKDSGTEGWWISSTQRSAYVNASSSD